MVTYDVLRHACTPRVPGIYVDWKADTFYRNMDREGVNQALRLHDNYKREGAVLRLGLHSPALRAMYTLAIAVAGHNIPLIGLNELFTPDDADGEILGPAFKAYNTNTRAYATNPVLHNALMKFGRTAAKAIEREVEKVGIEDGVVVIANHAVTGNYIAYALADWNRMETCLNTEMGYADRLRVRGFHVEHIPFL